MFLFICKLNFDMNKYFIFTILLFFAAESTFSQEHYFNQPPLLFKEAVTNEILIIDNEQTLIKVNKNLTIPIKQNGFPGKLSNYVPFNIKNKTYLVHEGCGPVMEFRNDSLVRIDNSFLQLSQIESSKFVYKNEIYFYGGYGVFTFKNILTKYDFKLNEWFLVKTKNSDLVPPLCNAFFKTIGPYLYVFGGKNEDVNKDILYYNEEYVYRLNLNTLVWEKFKTSFFKMENFLLSNNIESLFSFQYLNDTFIFDKTNWYGINFKENNYTKYNNYFRIPIHSAVYSNNMLYSIVKNDNHDKAFKYYFKSFPISTIVKNPSIKKSFYFNEHFNNIYVLYGLLVIVILWLLYKKRSYFIYLLNPSKPFYYKLLFSELYFKGIKVKHLSEDEIKILNKMALHPNQFISLNEFNEMFTKDYENENYAAIVKRREKKLETFLQLLANVSSYDLIDLLHERKNEVDKRIKEVLFLPNKIKFVNH